MNARFVVLAAAIAAVAFGATAEPPAKKDPPPAPAPKPPAPKAPVNSKCPVKEEPIDAAITVEYKEKLIAFCCESCREEFNANPEAFMKRLGS